MLHSAKHGLCPRSFEICCCYQIQNELTIFMKYWKCLTLNTLWYLRITRSSFYCFCFPEWEFIFTDLLKVHFILCKHCKSVWMDHVWDTAQDHNTRTTQAGTRNCWVTCAGLCACVFAGNRLGTENSWAFFISFRNILAVWWVLPFCSFAQMPTKTQLVDQ